LSSVNQSCLTQEVRREALLLGGVENIYCGPQSWDKLARKYSSLTRPSQAWEVKKFGLQFIDPFLGSRKVNK